MALEHEDLPRATWRLYADVAHDGATNMAIDEAILLAVSQGQAPPTLRFYGWDPPCVSVGYAQSILDEIDLDVCRQKGYTWVRRPTGGRAVLHVDELTYSIIVPLTEPRVRGDILTSYRLLSQGLVAGLRLLGCDVAQAGYQSANNTAAKSAACFDVPSHYEVTAQGHKLLGSAQVRRKGVVLQHGALPLAGDVTRLAEVLALPVAEREIVRKKLSQRAITLAEALGHEVTFDQVEAALIRGLSRALNLDLRRGELRPDERRLADELRARYAGDEWTFCR
jgi:lipoate-protein ligase A